MPYVVNPPQVPQNGTCRARRDTFYKCHDTNARPHTITDFQMLADRMYVSLEPACINCIWCLGTCESTPAASISIHTVSRICCFYHRTAACVFTPTPCDVAIQQQRQLCLFSNHAAAVTTCLCLCGALVGVTLNWCRRGIIPSWDTMPEMLIVKLAQAISTAAQGGVRCVDTCCRAATTALVENLDLRSHAPR